MSRFIVSNSGLKQFFSGCPAKWTFYKKYSLAVPPKPLAFGIAVHEAVEEGLSQPHYEDPYVYEIASKMLRVLKNRGYKIIDREINHLAPLTKDIWVAGRIDLVAELDGLPVLVDWKTAARNWSKIKTEDGEVHFPQDETIQGTIYTTPPPRASAWSDDLHYIVVPRNGVSKIHKYHRNEEDVQNLIRLATLMKDASDRGWFPKMKGYQCLKCDWKDACWQTKNWERHYVERK